jgi:hypothetical protein
LPTQKAAKRLLISGFSSICQDWDPAREPSRPGNKKGREPPPTAKHLRFLITRSSGQTNLLNFGRIIAKATKTKSPIEAALNLDHFEPHLNVDVTCSETVSKQPDGVNGY